MTIRFPAALAAALAISLTASACATEAPALPGLRDGIAVSYKAVQLSKDKAFAHRVGQLIYRGGLEISSPDRRFGGWSGLVISADGKHLLAQSDEAHWLRADLVYDASGDLAGIKNAQLADMLNMSGKTMAKEEGDAEGLEALTDAGPDGPVVVSFERDPRMWRYDVSKSLDVTPTVVPSPASIHELDGSNQGLEGLTVLKPGTLLAVSEAPHDASAKLPAWLLPAPASKGASARLRVERHAPYEISDAAMGPDRRYLYLLERHYFGMIGGLAIAVRRIKASDVRAGATLQGTEIAKFDTSEAMDNMEGLALRRGANGKTFLYMISDDNYNPLQRTLLMMFELAPQDQ